MEELRILKLWHGSYYVLIIPSGFDGLRYFYIGREGHGDLKYMFGVYCSDDNEAEDFAEKNWLDYTDEFDDEED